MRHALPLQQHFPTVSPLAYGCMGLGGHWDDSPWTSAHVDHAQAAVEAALEIGVTLFDHADIYTRGKAESVFGELMRRQPSLRDRIVLQSKCGIRFAEGDLPGRYDLSGGYIVEAVEASLKRLGTEQLDILLLHRPDPLMQPDEIAEAFQRLRGAGKVSHFGVSNMNAGQMAWLGRALDQPLVVNQLELGLATWSRWTPAPASTTGRPPPAPARWPGPARWSTASSTASSCRPGPRWPEAASAARPPRTPPTRPPARSCTSWPSVTASARKASCSPG